MQVISSFLACNDGCRVGKTRLLRDGAALPGTVSGAVIEAQFRLADGRALIWLTDDCSYEEGLTIYLLSPAGQILDQVIGGARYTPALLTIVETGDAHVDFKFFGSNAVMRLSVGDPRRRRIIPAGYRYGGWRWSRRLSLQPAPSPDRPAKPSCHSCTRIVRVSPHARQSFAGFVPMITSRGTGGVTGRNTPCHS